MFPRNVPTLRALTTTSLPSAPMRLLRTSLAARQSPLGSSKLITGMKISATSDETTLPVAAPIMKPTASASTEFFVRKSRNPLNMDEASVTTCAWYYKGRARLYMGQRENWIYRTRRNFASRSMAGSRIEQSAA